MGKGQLLSCINTTTDLVAEGVVVFWGELFFHFDLFEALIFPFFYCEQCITYVEVIFNEVDCFVEVEAF